MLLLYPPSSVLSHLTYVLPSFVLTPLSVILQILALCPRIVAKRGEGGYRIQPGGCGPLWAECSANCGSLWPKAHVTLGREGL